MWLSPNRLLCLLITLWSIERASSPVKAAASGSFADIGGEGPGRDPGVPAVVRSERIYWSAGRSWVLKKALHDVRT
jgi:hypothetical protein